MKPLLPDADWWREHLRFMAAGYSEQAAARKASEALRLHGKDFVRGRIAGDVVLSFPVEGGAAVSKRLSADSGQTAEGEALQLSDHGKWRREHLGAWTAAYGRTPFFIHLMPRIEQIYADSVDDKSLINLSEAFYQETLHWIAESIRIQKEETENQVIQQRIRELSTNINTNLSIFDAIFRFGKETALFC